MKHYILKVRNQDEKRNWRELIIPANAKLSEFAKLIVNSFGLDMDHCYGFYDNLKNISRSKVCYELFVDLGEEHEDNAFSVKKNTLQALWDNKSPKDKKWLMLFDYGDEWYFELELVKAENHPKKQKTVLRRKGEDYEQYPDYNDEEGYGKCLCPECEDEKIEASLGLNQRSSLNVESSIHVVLYVRYKGKYLLGRSEETGRWEFILVTNQGEPDRGIEEIVVDYMKGIGIDDNKSLTGLVPSTVDANNAKIRLIIIPYYLELSSEPSRIKDAQFYKEFKLFSIQDIVEKIGLPQMCDAIRQINIIDDEKEFGHLKGRF